MPRTITVDGSNNSLFLRMNADLIEFATAPTTPVTWTPILTGEWPVTITNSAAASARILNVVFTMDLTITSSYGDILAYFIIGSRYITFNGAGYNINISIGGYPGFLQNGTSSVNGYANIIVQNLNASVSGGSLSSDAGWLCQAYFGRGALSNSVTSCSSNGEVTGVSGGVAGSYVGSCGIAPGYSNGSITFSSCTSSGLINTSGASGGIVASYAGQGGDAAGRLGSATFINCTCTSVVASMNGGGGIAGEYAGSNYGSVTITNCTFNTISLIFDYCGGIVGSNVAFSNGNATITSCSVIATGMRPGAGGFCGELAAYTNGTLTISDCINNIAIEGVFENCGGFCGYRAAANGAIINMINCTNNGSIGNGCCGFLGRGGSGAASLTFTNCVNNGTFPPDVAGGGFASSDATIQTCINCTNNAALTNSCGGFFTSGNVTTLLTLTDCRNTGNITVTNAGGLICDFDCSSAIITNCSNTGNIGSVFGNNSGGIVGNGFNPRSSSFTNCSNSGNIFGNNCGGIAGAGSFTIAGIVTTFTNCTNSGSLNTEGSGGITGGGCCREGFAYFINCTNSGALNESRCGGIGGINISGNAAQVYFTSCRNTGIINGPNAGGIIGFGAGLGATCITSLTDCVNSGNITSNGTNAGGIVGGSASKVTITRCSNTGSIDGGNSGGIVGSTAGFGGRLTSLIDCVNSGNITSNGSSAGGIVGSSANNVTITTCSNTGSIGGDNSGGIVGGTSGTGGSVTSLTNCVNSGDITSTGTNAGGIVGGSANNVTISRCSNTGSIAASSSGGIAGSAAGSGGIGRVTSLINCVNSGDITSTGSNAGGIVGNVAANTTITRCFNTGAIAGTGSGGIAGASFGSTATANNSAAITSCYSTGAISGTNAGGIASASVGSSSFTSSISTCYSLGNISATSGGIVYSCRASNRLTISNCYSFGTVGTAGSGIVRTGQVQPLSLVNCYVANNSWSDASANAVGALTGYPTGIGIATGQATTWTSISANTPYLLSTFFSFAGSTTTQQIYTPDAMVITLNSSSVPGYYQPGLYSIGNTSQTGNTLTTNVYVVAGTTPKYFGYGYTTYTLTNVNGSSSKPISVTINDTTGVLSFVLPFPCFLEGTKILCFENNKEVYRPVESLRKGDLVKTIYNGYLPIHKIGTSPMYNPNTDDRISDRLYKCSKENYPALFEDLYITGCHSILVPSLTYLQVLITKASLGKLYVTDKHCRLMAWVDEKAEPYTREGIYNIYHIALENDDYYMNYGIYANGLLVESCSKRYLTEMSNMRLLGEADNSVTEDESPPAETIFPKMANLVEIC